MRKQVSVRRAQAGFVLFGSALTVLLAGCGGSSNGSTCHNLPKAVGLIGQTDYAVGTANTGGVSSVSLSSPAGAVSTEGTLSYLVDTANNRILGFNSAPSGIGTAADFIIGQNSPNTNLPGTGPTSLAFPSKVSIATDGTHLVVADTGNNRVLIWNSLPRSNKAADVVLGQTDFTSSSSGLSSGTCGAGTVDTDPGDKLNNPTAAMIGNGKLVVVDQTNQRVLIWNTIPTANGTPADVVLGQPNFCSNTQGTLNTSNPQTPFIEFRTPSDVYTDGFNLFISDSVNNRVLYWPQIPTVSNTTASFVIGQINFSSSTGSVSQSVLNGPTGLGSDGSNLYVADTTNNRVLVFPYIPSANGELATGVYGQQDFSHFSYNDPDQNDKPGDQSNGQSTSPKPTSTNLFSPSGVSAFGGTVYVSDRQNNRVIEFAAGTSVNGTNTTECN